MFGSSRSASSPHTIYSSSMSSLGLGYALWYPEPDDTGELQIGDVGYIDDGSFVRVLNIDSSKPEHRVESWNPPFEIRQALPPDAFRRKTRLNPVEPGHYPSHGVRLKNAGASITA